MLCLEKKRVLDLELHIKESLKFIESEEMRDYLRENTGLLNSWDCTRIVTFAPAPIERKIPVLDLIAEQSGYDGNFYNPAKIAAECRTALAERYDNPPGTIFWLRAWSRHEEYFYYGDIFFTDFDAAVCYLKEQQKELDDPNTACCFSHSIEKYIPGENGAMKEYCEWMLDRSGEIWYFDYGSAIGSKFAPKGWDALWDYGGDSLYLPVPFKPGDIILADCRPFAKERHVLITDVGDNHDCCSVQCLYLLPNGKLNIAAFKHNGFFWGTEENSHISGLYRASLWHGELSEDEAPLCVVSAALKANPLLGDGLQAFIMKDRADWGVTWEQLKNEFGF